MGIEQIRLMKEMAKYPKRKVQKPIAKKSVKRIEQEKNYDKNETQWEWFLQRRKELTGKCSHCNGRTTINDDEKFHFCIAHILPKAYFPSVSCHPLNYIELCSFGNNCHGNYDNRILDLIDMNCFSTIVDRFVAMYPMIDKNERRRIPNVLMQYIEVEI